MNTEEIIKKVSSYIRQNLYGEETGHDWWHIVRVLNISIEINKTEKKMLSLLL